MAAGAINRVQTSWKFSLSLCTICVVAPCSAPGNAPNALPEALCYLTTAQVCSMNHTIYRITLYNKAIYRYISYTTYLVAGCTPVAGRHLERMPVTLPCTLSSFPAHCHPSLHTVILSAAKDLAPAYSLHAVILSAAKDLVRTYGNHQGEKLAKKKS